MFDEKTVNALREIAEDAHTREAAAHITGQMFPEYQLMDEIELRARITQTVALMSLAASEARMSLTTLRRLLSLDGLLETATQTRSAEDEQTDALLASALDELDENEMLHQMETDVPEQTNIHTGENMILQQISVNVENGQGPLQVYQQIREGLAAAKALQSDEENTDD